MSQMSRSIQRIAQGLSGCKASSDDERHCQQLQDHKINGSSGSLQTCHSRSNTCELALRVYVQGAVSKNVKAVEGIDSQRRVTFITIPWNDDQLSDLMMNEGDMSRKRIVIGGWKSLKMVFEKMKMQIFDSKHVFYTFQVISHRFRRKKFFRPPKIFLSPSWPEKTKFSKKIKIRIFDSKCVFYTFQVISHRLRPKKIFSTSEDFSKSETCFWSNFEVSNLEKYDKYEHVATWAAGNHRIVSVIISSCRMKG